MPKIRPIDMTTIDQIFNMESGYVLDFTDRTFAEFFAGEAVIIDINDDAYHAEGNSKAKRLRYFLKQADAALAVRTLEALWEYRQARREKRNAAETVINAQGRLLDIIARLGGTGSPSEAATARPAYNWPAVAEIRRQLSDLENHSPQERGFLFETLLKSTFDLFGMRARDPFRNRGEQIDGSFELANEIYLLEAKWLNAPVGVADLHVFHGKIEQKAAWARGLFISYSGFTEDGLHAFGQGKRIVCMDGPDLDEAFRRQNPVSSVIEHKVRRAAESGNYFVRVRNLFPE